MAAALSDRSTWLCPDAGARERLLDMDERIRRPRVVAFAILGLATLSTFPTEGWWPFGLLVVAVLGYGLVDTFRRYTTAPEYAIVGSWAFSQLIVAFAVVMTGGAKSHALSWLVVPLVTLPARFGVRGVAAGSAYTAVLLVLATIFAQPVDASAPPIYATVFVLSALAAIAILSTALMQSDLEHRTEAIIDGLTGMLNRRAMSTRLAELEAQAQITRQPIAVIAGDLDHFKRINDEHGHATGDAVLVDVAYRLRKRLRAFDLAYRVGGEEFLIVLPGATIAEAASIAETLREAVSSELVGGVEATISFGVSGTDGAGFDASAVLADADAALYDAKAEGRDRVVVAGADKLALAA